MRRIALLLLTLSSPAFAQAPAAPAAPAPPPKTATATATAPAKPAAKKDTKPQKVKTAPKKKAEAKPRREVDVKSDALEVKQAVRQLLFKGHVQATSDDVKVTCDESTANYDEQNKVKDMTCRGNAHVLQKPKGDAEPREAWGQVAVFDNDARILTLTGSPVLKEGTNTVRGEKITVFLNENRSVVEKPVVTVTEPPKMQVEDGSAPKK